MTDQALSASRNPVERLAKGSSLNIAGAICQQSALFATTAVIGRLLGSKELGQYALTYAMLTVIGLLAMCGFRAALTRFIATQLADNDPAAVRGTIRLCIGVSVGAAILFSVVLFVAAPQVASLFDNSALADAVRWAAVALPGATIRDSALAATRGWRTQRASTLIAWVYEPLVRLVVTVCAIAAGLGITGAYLALPIGSWTAGVAAIVALRRRLRLVEPASPRYDTRKIMSFSVVSWGNTLATTGLLWADTLILGHYRSEAEVGVYTIATRIVTLAIFVMAPVDSAFAPQFAHHFHLGEKSVVARIYASATGWILRLSLPAFVVLLVFPTQLLDLVGGAAYTTGTAVTVILAVGQLVNAATGPCGNALTMAGKIGINMVNNVLALALNLALNVIWIPQHGIIGAAMAWSVSLGFVNLIKVAELYVIARIHPFSRATAKGFAAASAAAAAAVVIRFTFGAGILVCIVGAVVVVIVYVATTVLVGLEPEDRALIGRLRASRARSA